MGVSVEPQPEPKPPKPLSVRLVMRNGKIMAVWEGERDYPIPKWVVTLNPPPSLASAPGVPTVVHAARLN